MVNNNTNLKESKTLYELINKNNAYLRNPRNKADDDKRKNEFINEFLPIDLKDDIDYVVQNSYDGNYEEYLKSVELYFKTFTWGDLIIANYYYTKSFNEEVELVLKRRMKKERKSKIYHASVLLKLVGKGGKKYCSHTLFNHFKTDKTKEQEFIRSQKLVSADGNILELAKCTKTVKQNIAEKLNINETLQRIADDKKFTFLFLTFTLPGEYHPNPSMGENNYNGVSPKDSAILLNSKINHLNTSLKNNGLKPARDFFGTISSEAHQDGVLHKHGIYFIDMENVELLKKLVFDIFPNMKKQYLDAEKRKYLLDLLLENKRISQEVYDFRVSKIKNPVIAEDFSKPRFNKDTDTYVEGKFRATPLSYLFKYLFKSVSCFDNDLDIMAVKFNYGKILTKEQIQENQTYTSMLNNAFRSYNSIRGFSYFGMEKCLSKFRYLARNIKKIGAELSLRLHEIIINNDLYAFINERHFDDIENEYILTSSGNKKLVGILYNGVRYLKSVFKMFRGFNTSYKEVEDDDGCKFMEVVKTNLSDEAVNVYKDLAIESESEILKYLVNPSYSRKAKSSEDLSYDNNFWSNIKERAEYLIEKAKEIDKDLNIMPILPKVEKKNIYYINSVGKSVPILF